MSDWSDLVILLFGIFNSVAYQTRQSRYTTGDEIISILKMREHLMNPMLEMNKSFIGF